MPELYWYDRDIDEVVTEYFGDADDACWDDDDERLVRDLLDDYNTDGEVVITTPFAERVVAEARDRYYNRPEGKE